MVVRCQANSALFINLHKWLCANHWVTSWRVGAWLLHTLALRSRICSFLVQWENKLQNINHTFCGWSDWMGLIFTSSFCEVVVMDKHNSEPLAVSESLLYCLYCQFTSTHIKRHLLRSWLWSLIQFTFIIMCTMRNVIQRTSDYEYMYHYR